MPFEIELCLLGQKRNVDGLRELVESTSKETLLDEITELIHKDNFINFWDYLLQGFDDSHDSHAKRFAVSQHVLKELESQNISSSRTTSIITSFLIELNKFHVDHVLHFSKFCMERIQKAKSSSTIWKDLFPSVLKTLESIESFQHSGEEITGSEYKETVIRSLCIIEWSPSIIIPLTVMFTEISLTNDEHQSVVKNLCHSMEKLTSQEIPAFIYQLLLLCVNRNSECVFLKLQQYFGSRIYKNGNCVDNSESLDLISNAADVDVIQSESTVLFHIQASAGCNPQAILHYLATLKHLTRMPDFLLFPAHLTMLLTIASVDSCEASVIQTVIQALDTALTESERRTDSYWYREQVPHEIKLEGIFKQIIFYSDESRDMVLQGLVHLSFNMLSVKKSPATRDSVTEVYWKFGALILVRLIKQKRHMAHSIFHTLTNEIMRSQSGEISVPYLECLQILCKRFTLEMLKNRASVLDLMETMLLVFELVANQILDAIIPLTKASQSLRDELVLFLKKALYSRKLETRKISVTGFLKLLRHLRISDAASLSQMSNLSSSSNSCSSSGVSLFTQMSLVRSGRASAARNTGGTAAGGALGAFSNEALCWEILGVLRRCFNQQWEVRAQLYEGLYDTICTNPVLGVPVIEVLFAHFNNYYVSEKDTLPPIHIAKLAKVQENEAILIEPLGKFIYAVSLIVNKIQESENDCGSILKFEDILENLCERMPLCELVHFELDDGTDLSDIVPESQLKVFVLKESLQIYEALIGYKICSWNPDSKNYASNILGLFNGYSRLAQFSKDLPKQKKMRKKDKDATNSDATKKEGAKPKVLKLPDSALDLQATGKILNLLLRSDVDWTDSNQADILKSKVEVHQYFLQATINIIQCFKNNKDTESKRMKAFYGYCTEIAATLFDRCIKRYEEYSEFDQKSANLSLDCFYVILEHMCSSFKEKLVHFLHIIGGLCKDEELDVHIKVIVDVYLKLFVVDEDDDFDAETGKMLLIVINTIKLLAKQMPTLNTALSIQLIGWSKKILSEKSFKYKPAVASFIGLLFNLQMRYKSGFNIFKCVSLRLGDIYGTIKEEPEAVEEIKLVNELTADTILLELHNCIKLFLQDIDYLLTRLKSEYYLIKRAGDDGNENRQDNLKRKERGLCCQLCLLIELCSIVINLKIPLGTISESVMKNLAHIFTTLCSITQYFLSRCTIASPSSAIQNSRFESVVMKTGKQLSPIVYTLLIYVEEYENVERGTQAKKQQKAEVLKAKVWKERRRLPQLVYGMEKFSSLISQLTTRSKLNLSKYIGQGTTRDFRIKADTIKEIQRNSDETMDTTANPTQEGSVANDSVSTATDSNDDVTPTKKARKK